VPVAAAFGALTFAQLCLVASAQALGQIVFSAASGAHLKALVPASGRTEALARFEATTWTAVTIGPALGGLLISTFGKTVTVTLDAVSYLLSALYISRLRAPEPPPPSRVTVPPPAGSGASASTSAGDVVVPSAAGAAESPTSGVVVSPVTGAEVPCWWDGVAAGWRYVFRRPALRALFANAMLFGGAVMWCSPLTTVLMLGELGFTPWQYGLALGIPGLGGIAGALLARRLIRRLGERRVLLTSGAARTVWLLPIPLATPDTMGLTTIVVANLLLLMSAGVFNPTFGSYRMSVTADDHMARVQTVWSIASRTVQPLFMVAGGVIAGLASVRIGLWIGAALVLLSVFLLPWRTVRDSAASEGPLDAEAVKAKAIKAKT